MKIREGLFYVDEDDHSQQHTATRVSKIQNSNVSTRFVATAVMSKMALPYGLTAVGIGPAAGALSVCRRMPALNTAASKVCMYSGSSIAMYSSMHMRHSLQYTYTAAES